MTIREIAYIILDEARLLTDDITLNEEHAMFLASKYRALLLSNKYKTAKLEVSDSNYQVLCINLHNTTTVDGSECDKESYLRSNVKVPNLMKIGNSMVTPYDYLKGANFSFIPIERMRYVGYNKFLRNIIYAALGHDGYLYLKSLNPMFKYLQNVKFTGVFEDAIQASNLLCDTECNLMDRVFPIEEQLVEPLIELCVKELTGANYKPKDERNNANDDAPKVTQK